MSSRVSDIRDLTLLCAACVVGVAISPLFLFVGAPLFAAGAVGLVLRRSAILALGGAVSGAVTGAVIRPEWLVLTVPLTVAVFAAVALLPRWGYQIVGLGLVLVIGLSAFGMDALTAVRSGMSLVDGYAQQSQQALADAAETLRSAGATPEGVEQIGRIFAGLWPSAYVQLAVLTAALVLVAIAWASRSVDRLGIPAMYDVDLNINVIWLPVAALLLLAAGAYQGFESTLFVVGVNIALIARLFLLVQGLAVCGWLMRKGGLPTAARGAGYAALALVDTLFPAVSLLGLVDFWGNIRRLPRDGQEAPEKPEHGNEY